MLFYKPLVSLITAIALASTVTASATPVRRNDGPQCNPQVQKLYCCTETGTLGSLDPVTKILGGLLGLNLDAVVAAGCVLNVLCSNGVAVCCQQDVEQYGIVNINAGCITL